MVGWREKSVQLSFGVNVAYKVWGDEDANNKVLGLHGWLDNSATWDKLVPLLVNQFGKSMVFVSIDLPGHGHSDHYPFKLMRYRFPDWISVVEDFVCQIGWEKFHLMGHSMGGGISSVYAAVLPHRVRSVVSVEAFGPFTEDDDEKVVEKFRESLTNFTTIVQRAPKEYTSEEEAVTKLRLNNPTLHLDSAQCLVRRSLKKVVTLIEDEQGERERVHYEFRHDGRLLVRDQTRAISIRQAPYFIKAIQCPFLVVTGEAGLSSVVRFINERKDLLSVPFVHLHVPGAHHLHLDCPENFVTDVIEFLERNFNPNSL